MADTIEGDRRESLSARTLRGVRWTYLSTFVNACLQVLVTTVLARLLAPEAFGLVVMGGLVLRFGQYFAQMGISQAIIQRQVLTREHVRAGFWISAFLGAVFSVLVWVGAPLGGAAFGASALTDVLRLMALSFFVSGLSMTASALLRRHMRFRTIAIADVLSCVVGYAAVGITLALLGFGVWSLVAAGLAQAVLVAIVYNLMARPALRPTLVRRAYGDILGFGSMVSAISFMEFLNTNLDTMVVGRTAGATSLGFYSRALGLTGLPMYYISIGLSRVLFPALSRIQKDSARVRAVYLDVICVFAGICLPIALGMSGAAREIILVLYGDKWLPSVQIMQIVAVAAGIATLSHFGGITLEATAHFRQKLVMRGGQLVLFAGLLVGLGRFGLVGYGLAFAISEICLHAVMAASISRLHGATVRQVGSAYWPGLLGGVSAFVLLALESWLGRRVGVPAGAVLLLQILTGFGLVVFVFFRLDSGRLYYVCLRYLERDDRSSLHRRATTRVAEVLRVPERGVSSPEILEVSPSSKTGKY